jgi:integrase
VTAGAGRGLTGPRIRRWRKNLLDSGVGPVTVAKAYRLLKSIMTTAVDDRLIGQNPCKIKGAGEEKSPERPVLTLNQVFVLADAFADRRYRLLVLLAVFCSLRWGELAALRRKHIDTSASLIRVEAAVVELVNGALVTGPPKSASGLR